MYVLKYIHLISIALLSEMIIEIVSEHNYTAAEGSEERFEILSRRKRFLTFPDGSSFQLVFCVQTSALIPISDIFLYSNTAALAWNLPNEPSDLLGNPGSDGAQRRQDQQTHTQYMGEKRPAIVNPAFAKRNIDNFQHRPRRPTIRIDKKRMHEKQLRREFLNHRQMDTSSVRFHRSSRLGLFQKLEKLFEAVGEEGEQCVLRQLCKAAKLPGTQEAFLDEILRVVFTLPKGPEFNDPEHKHYDEVFAEETSCEDRYPECEW